MPEQTVGFLKCEQCGVVYGVDHLATCPIPGRFWGKHEPSDRDKAIEAASVPTAEPALFIGGIPIERAAELDRLAAAPTRTFQLTFTVTRDNLEWARDWLDTKLLNSIKEHATNVVLIESPGRMD